jgi:hypothetical protein
MEDAEDEVLLGESTLAKLRGAEGDEDDFGVDDEYSDVED